MLTRYQNCCVPQVKAFYLSALVVYLSDYLGGHVHRRYGQQADEKFNRDRQQHVDIFVVVLGVLVAA